MKFEHTEVFNFEGAFRGLRNPMNSHNKSDSYFLNCGGKIDYHTYVLGKNDLDLAQRMIKGGNEQSKFLRQVMVSVDITSPRYIWSEFDTYKIGTVANSCSTMHKLKDYPFTIDMFELDDNYPKEIWDEILNYLEKLRIAYQDTKDIKFLRAMKQALPESFKQKRTVTLNYAVIRTIYFQRRHHLLKEWNTDFINWVNNLPYSKELICIN